MDITSTSETNKSTELYLKGNTYSNLMQPYNRIVLAVGSGGSRVSVHNIDMNPASCNIASAATITLGGDGIMISPPGLDYYKLTGTTNIDTITAEWVGRVITLQCSSAGLTLNNGTGNLKLNGAANYAMGVDDTITLRYDGTNWVETAGSNN